MKVQGSQGKSGDELRSGNKVSQNTFKNTPEDDLDTFYDTISHLTSKYRPYFFGSSKIAGLDRSELVRTFTNTSVMHI